MGKALDIALRFMADHPEPVSVRPTVGEKGFKGEKSPVLIPFYPLNPFSPVGPPPLKTKAEDDGIQTPTHCPECFSGIEGLTCPECGWRLCEHCCARVTASAVDAFCNACGPHIDPSLQEWNRQCMEAAKRKNKPEKS